MEREKTFKKGPKQSKIVKNGSNPPIHNLGVTALLLRESLKKGCFYPNFDKFNFRTKVYLYFITTGANMFHVCHYSGILQMNLFLVYPWPYIKQANIQDTQQCFLFELTNLTVYFFLFFQFYPPKYMQTPLMICRMAEVK